MMAQKKIIKSTRNEEIICIYECYGSGGQLY